MTSSRIVFAACALMLLSRGASAQMTPLTDDRSIDAKVQFDGRTDQQAKTPPAPFATWFDFANANVTGTVAGSGHATSFQSSFFSPASINISGGSAGGWDVIPAQHYNAKSHLRFKVRANQCLEYSFFAQADPGFPVTATFVDFKGPAGTLYHVVNDTINVAGRIASGDYEFEAESSVFTAVEHGDGGNFSMIWQCNTCPSSLISVHPVDAVVRCDTVATFCVVPNGPVGSFTYLWRHNSVLLTNSAHYSGVTTPCLSVLHACFADSGAYDVLVTSGATTEPSRPAHFGVSSIAVGVPRGGDPTWSLGDAMPSPSRASIVLRYSAPAPFVTRVTIHDAGGRIVRRLVDGVLDAAGTITWDGRTTAGAPATPGIYFLRFEHAGVVEVRRIVRVH